MKKTALVGLTMMVAALTAFGANQNDKIEKLPDDCREPVLMLGDSMMRLLGRSMERELKKIDVKADSFSSLGSGLARMDAFDWFAKIDTLMDEQKPATVVVTLGANDRQPLSDGNGNLLQVGTAEWRAEYSTRVGRAMDAILNKGAKQVIWLCLPDMKENIHQTYAMELNKIYAEQAQVDARKDKVIVFDIRSSITRTPGKFSMFVMSNMGQALTVRDVDGIHLTVIGAKRVAEMLITTFW